MQGKKWMDSDGRGVGGGGGGWGAVGGGWLNSGWEVGGGGWSYFYLVCSFLGGILNLDIFCFPSQWMGT